MEAERLRHDLVEPHVEDCVEKLRRLAARQPRKTRFTPMELYVIEWASFKRRVAEAAAECLARLVPGVEQVYYIELSDDYAGNDIDLVVVIDKKEVIEREVEETLEEILRKLAEASGIRMHALTNTGRPFELHVAEPGSLQPRPGLVRLYP